MNRDVVDEEPFIAYRQHDDCNDVAVPLGYGHAVVTDDLRIIGGHRSGQHA